MLSRDLTATVVKTFFEELDDVRDGGRRDEEYSPYVPLYTRYLKKEREWFLQVGVEDITVFFADDPIYKLEMLAELMYHDARSVADREIQAAMFRKIMALYDVIDIRSMEFSVGRMKRADEMKKWLDE